MVHGEAKISFFGPRDEPEVKTTVILRKASGEILAEKQFANLNLKRGLETIGNFQFEAPRSKKGQALELVIQCSGDIQAENRWRLWQFPRLEGNLETGKVHVTTDWSPTTEKILARGGSVLWLPKLEEIRGNIPQPFSSMYWNAPWTDGGESHTLGILCDPDHEVFAYFPTQFHTNWQWWSVLTRARPMILDEWNMEHEWPKAYRPLVQAIDGWNLNRKLGLLMEARVGKGKLMICSMDLLTDLEKRPVAKALKKGILTYMNSQAFSPEHEINRVQISRLIR